MHGQRYRVASTRGDLIPGDWPPKAGSLAGILAGFENRLAAAVDSRAGTKGVTRMLFKWADVEAICNHWGERARDFLGKQGVEQKRS